MEKKTVQKAGGSRTLRATDRANRTSLASETQGGNKTTTPTSTGASLAEPVARSVVSTHPRPDREIWLRPYTLADTEEIVRMISRELPKLPNYEGIAVDADRVRFLLQNNEHNATFLGLAACDSHNGDLVGGVAAYCTPTMFSFATIAQDTFLFLQPAYRSLSNVRKLIRAYKDWAKARGASIIAASHTGGFKTTGMEALLMREGFMPVGQLFHLRKDEK